MEDFWLALGGGAAAGAASKKVAEALVGPVATEIGEDAKKAYVAVRTAATGSIVSIANHLREIINPDLIGTVRPQITLAVMQHAAGVDDPDLQKMFAHLLASEIRGDAVHPSFPGIIGQMSPADGVVFRSVARLAVDMLGADIAGTFDDGRTGYFRVYSGYVNTPGLAVSISNLVRLGLVQEEPLIGGLSLMPLKAEQHLQQAIKEALSSTPNFRPGAGDKRHWIRRTPLGREFAIAVGAASE